MPNVIEILAHIANEVADGSVNYDVECPDTGCHGLHAPNEQYLDSDGIYTCPIEETRFVDCSNCGWTLITRYSEEPRRINDALMCDECAEQYVECCDCQRMVYDHEANHECYENETYCERCWNNRGGCHCSECEPENEDEIREGESVGYCRDCGARVHMNLLTEEFVCDHVAESLLAQFVPVKLTRPIPTVTAVSPDPEWVDVVADAMDEVLSGPEAA